MRRQGRAPPAPSFFASFSKSRAVFLQAFPKIPLAVLWDFKGLRIGDRNPKSELSKFFGRPAESQRPAHQVSCWTGSSGHPRRSTFPRINGYRHESRCVCCRRNLLRPSGDFACEAKISLAKRKNFACETILFRQVPRKLLKSLGREISDFAVSCDFKGLRPILFRAFFSPSVFRSARRA